MLINVQGETNICYVYTPDRNIQLNREENHALRIRAGRRGSAFIILYFMYFIRCARAHLSLRHELQEVCERIAKLLDKEGTWTRMIRRKKYYRVTTNEIASYPRVR